MGYYFDTSIWMDFLEDGDEVGNPKSSYARALISLIAKEGGKIIVSDLNPIELEKYGYTLPELDEMFGVFFRTVMFVETSEKIRKRARDLAGKRNIPRKDAVHALLARKYRAIFVATDNHFKNVSDIIIAKRPADVF